jgi:hypothetical protein
MKNINDNVFLHKISERIKDGDFDSQLTLPFQTRNLFLSSIKGRILRKLETNSTPILSDNELEDCINETKETSINIINMYLKIGFMKKTEMGYEFTDLYNLAIKTIYK